MKSTKTALCFMIDLFGACKDCRHVQILLLLIHRLPPYDILLVPI